MVSPAEDRRSPRPGEPPPAPPPLDARERVEAANRELDPNPGAARDRAAEALVLAERTGDGETLLEALDRLAEATWRTADFESSYAAARRMESLLDPAKSPAPSARAAIYGARVHFRWAAYVRAYRGALRARSLLEGLAPGREAALAANLVGLVHSRLGRHEAAARELERALGLAVAIGDPGTEAIVLANIGENLLRQGAAAEAGPYLTRARDIFARADDRFHLAGVLHVLGERALEDREVGAARELVCASLALRQGIGDTHGQASAERGLAEIERRAGNLTEARRRFERVLEESHRIRAPQLELEALLGLSQVAAEDGDPAAAYRWLRAYLDRSGPAVERQTREIADLQVLFEAELVRLRAAEADRARRDRERREGFDQTREATGMIAAGFAHDLSNLLVTILGETSLARSETRETAASEHLARALQAARQGSLIAERMLAIAGRTPRQLRPVDLEALVREHEPLLRAAGGATCRVRLELEPAGEAALVDGPQILQVLVNLIHNAREAGASVVSIRSGVAGSGSFRLSVVDDGAGLGTDEPERIFEPFYTTRGSGRGVGLALVRGIVRAHQGSIEVESRPGRGTTFHLDLPLAAPEAPADGGSPRSIDERGASAAGGAAATCRSAGTDRSGGPPRPGGRPGDAGISAEPGAVRVLVLEDDPDIRQLLRALFEKRGWTADVPDDPEADPTSPRPDVIVIDQHLGQLVGTDLIPRLRSRWPGVGLVITSGLGEAAAVAESIERARFVPKPYEPEELIDAIGTLAPSAAPRDTTD